MKFSILLPTRNRLELLKYAIETVRRQDYEDWEIIVSDNFSEQDISGYVRSLGDQRIKYYRTDNFVPVTDNWNNALEKSTGDYVIMLGDDDGLMKGYFTVLSDVIKKYHHPDFIYISAFLYAYPGVLPGFPEGFLQPYGYATFLKKREEPYWLEKEKTIELVKHSMNFRVLFGYNMQFSVISRKLINTLKEKGAFFQSPYPDYYATNAMLLKAERVLVLPKPMVTIGISPKSFGYYYYNESEKRGMEFLRNLPDEKMVQRLEKVILPGTNMNTSWLLSMETIRSNYGSEFNFQVNYDRYRYLQILHVFGEFGLNKATIKPELRCLWNVMSYKEKIVNGVGLGIVFAIVRLFPERYRRKIANRFVALLGRYPIDKPKRIYGKFRNILDVFESSNTDSINSSLFK